MGVEDELDRHALVAADKSRKEGIDVVPTAVLDPPQAEGVKSLQQTGKQRPTQSVGTVTRRTTRRVSVGRSTPIRINLDADTVLPNMEIDNGRTRPKGQKDRKPKKGQHL